MYVGLSELFCRLQDADKSARYAARAYDLSRSLQLGDLNSRHHRAALLQMAAALRKKGELGDAHDYCSVKFRLKNFSMGKLGSVWIKDRQSSRITVVSSKRNFKRNVFLRDTFLFFFFKNDCQPFLERTSLMSRDSFPS